ncbi:hypothetical protein N0V84_003775 [Fusarium piperis]|uniref:Uncharacterized protein n=1 Tax=Fusarium piperis TaxID=1435070 RepID=A0A9W8WH43_9HYPO|nr:hypothetical protein N0V84_003775 [Fusarium piperis]
MAQPYPTVTPDEGGASFISKIHHEPYPFVSGADHSSHSVFITGGARGIGRSIARSFAKAGASKIALGDINLFNGIQEDLRRAAVDNGKPPPLVLLLHLDVTNESNVADAATTVKQKFGGKLDIVIQNAGYSSAQIPIREIDTEDWWTAFRVNVQGVFLVTKHFAPLLLEDTEGLKTMVQLNSVASIGVRPFSSNYAASKLAVLKFTEALLAEEAANGLLVFSVHPGAIMSEMTKIAMPEHLFHIFQDSPALAAETISWLTEERRTWLQGRWLSCNWDMQELLSRREEIENGDKLKMRLRC